MTHYDKSTYAKNYSLNNVSEMSKKVKKREREKRREREREKKNTQCNLARSVCQPPCKYCKGFKADCVFMHNRAHERQAPSTSTALVGGRARGRRRSTIRGGVGLVGWEASEVGAVWLGGFRVCL